MNLINQKYVAILIIPLLCVTENRGDFKMGEGGINYIWSYKIIYEVAHMKSWISKWSLWLMISVYSWVNVYLHHKTTAQSGTNAYATDCIGTAEGVTA